MSCRLRSDLQESLATIKRLKNADVVNESGEPPDVIATSSVPSLGSHDSTSTASTQKPDIFIMPDDVSEGIGLSVLCPGTGIFLSAASNPHNDMNFFFFCVGDTSQTASKGLLLMKCHLSVDCHVSRIS